MQHIHIAYEFQRRLRRPEQVSRDSLAFESVENLGSFASRSVPGDDSALLPAVSPDSLGDVLTVFHRRGEDQDGFPVPCQVDDLPAGGKDELFRIHRGFDLVADELASADVEVAEISFGATGTGHERRQISLLNHLLQARFIADFIQQIVRLADKPAFESERRGRQTDKANTGIDALHRRQEGPVGSFPVWRYQMAFICDDKVKPA